jgi:hypothetical protein
MGALRGAEDLARVFLHSAAAGIPEWAERTFGNPANAAATDAAVTASRSRAGLAGDVADVAGFLAPATAGLKGLKAATKIPAAIRAAPKIAEAIPAAVQSGRAALADLGGPGATKAEAAARLGIDYLPTFAERALGATGKAVAGAAALPLKHPVISALTGLGALAEYGRRNATGQAKAAVTKPAAAAAATSAPKPAGKAADANKVVSDILSALHEVDSSPPTFSDMASQLAASQGGKISARQLAALGDIAQKSATADYYEQGGAHKVAKPGDTAASMLEQQYVAQFQKALGDPNADPVAAQKEFEEKVLQLRKTQFIDPYGLNDGGGAE